MSRISGFVTVVGQQESTYQPLTHFLTPTSPPAPQRDQGENQKCKSKKTIMGQDRDSLVSERKRKKASDAKAITYHLPQAD